MGAKDKMFLNDAGTLLYYAGAVGYSFQNQQVQQNLTTLLLPLCQQKMYL
jgi:hypothetical protein